MKRTYEVRDRADKRAIREFLKREGGWVNRCVNVLGGVLPLLV